MIDPRIRAAAELEGVLGFPPLGAVVLGGDRKGREGLRRIALGILRERRASGVRTYVLTPVREGAGTTTLALALAQELSGLGVRSATIETSPIPATPAEEERRRAWRGSRDGADARIIRPTGDLTRHIAATGALDGGRHALIMARDELPGRFTICQHNGSAGLALDCVKESVEHALLTHEIVLLDAPPLLTSADAVLLMQMPAGAILVVRGGRDQVREITSAMREIERLAPPVVGAVLNTFRADGEGNNSHPDDVGWQAA
jgi:Mrp family chromosome partitioning ATPase